MTSERPSRSFTGASVGYSDEEPWTVLYDARTCKREEAIRCHRLEWLGEFTCQKRYARWLTRQEQWELAGRERYDDEIEEHIACPACGAPLGEACNVFSCDERVAPDEPPEGWAPGDDDPSWEYCNQGDDGAFKVYVCDADA